MSAVARAKARRVIGDAIGRQYADAVLDALAAAGVEIVIAGDGNYNAGVERVAVMLDEYAQPAYAELKPTLGALATAARMFKKT